jgi:hypothetical protein
MPYAQSEDSDDDSGVLLTDTYTTHCLSSHTWCSGLHCCIQQLSTASSCQSVYSIYIAHSPRHPHTWHSSTGSNKGQLSDDVTTKHKQCIGKPVLFCSSGRNRMSVVVCQRMAAWKACKCQDILKQLPSSGVL